MARPEYSPFSEEKRSYHEHVLAGKVTFLGGYRATVSAQGVLEFTKLSPEEQQRQAIAEARSALGQAPDPSTTVLAKDATHRDPSSAPDIDQHV